MPNGTKTPVSHTILNGSMYKWNPASGILNELSDCIDLNGSTAGQTLIQTHSWLLDV